VAVLYRSVTGDRSGKIYPTTLCCLWLKTELDRESDKSTRRIKEAVHIRKEGRQSLNWNEGSYMLSHTYDRFLTTLHLYCGKNREEELNKLFLMKISGRDRNVEVKMMVVCEVIVLFERNWWSCSGVNFWRWSDSDHDLCCYVIRKSWF